MMNQIRELLLDDGSSSYTDWFNGLSPDAAAKVATAKDGKTQHKG